MRRRIIKKNYLNSSIANYLQINNQNNNAGEHPADENNEAGPLFSIDSIQSVNNNLMDQLFKALENPSSEQVNVTTTLPANVYQLIKLNNLQVRHLIMKGIKLEELIRNLMEQLKWEKEYKEYWRDRYFKEKYGKTFAEWWKENNKE
jgi:hypothetical protein